MSKTIALRGAIAPIGSRGLVDQAVASLRKLIIAGKFGRDGTLPSQGALSRSLEVSRSVVREAMSILQSQGLVDVSQGRKPQVRPAGPEAVIQSIGTLLERADVSLLDLVEVRRPLESEIAGLAAARASKEDIAHLARSIEDLRQARSLDARIEADIRFHQVLARATRNPIFEWFLDSLARFLRESRRRTIAESGVEVPIAHHTEILKAVERGDAEAARRTMLHHLEMARGDIVKSSRKREKVR